MLRYPKARRAHLVAARGEVRRGVRKQRTAGPEERQPLHERIVAEQAHALVADGEAARSRPVLAAHLT